MDPRNIIRAGIAASAVIHLTFVTLALLFSEVRPFGPVEAETVAVDVVTPDQVPDKAPEPAPTPKPQPDLDLSSKPAQDDSASASAAPQPSQPPASQPSQAQAPATQPAALQPSPPPQQQAALAPSKPPANGASNPVAAPTAQSPQPAYVQPQPDISVKYHVLLGLPQDAPGDAFDAPASENADIEASSIAAFRSHLKDCSTLPKSIAPTDDVTIKLRVALTRDGRLAAEPLLIEAKASMKGPLLMQAAIGALRSCQPYAMLPTDRYDQWKTLDITFTPRDFGGS